MLNSLDNLVIVQNASRVLLIGLQYKLMYLQEGLNLLKKIKMTTNYLILAIPVSQRNFPSV